MIQGKTSSPLIQHRKEKQTVLDEKLQKLKENTLSGYQAKAKNIKRKSERLLDFSKYITQNKDTSVNGNYSRPVETPENCSKKANTVKTTPTRGKQLVKKRFKDKLKNNLDPSHKPYLSPYKKYTVNSNRANLKSRNKENMKQKSTFKNSKSSRISNFNSNYRKKVPQKTTPSKESASNRSHMNIYKPNISFN